MNAETTLLKSSSVKFLLWWYSVKKKQLKTSKSKLFYDSYPLSTSLPWDIGKAGSPHSPTNPHPTTSFCKDLYSVQFRFGHHSPTNPHPTTSFCKGVILGPVTVWPTYYVTELYRSPVWCMILLGWSYLWLKFPLLTFTAYTQKMALGKSHLIHGVN